MDRYPKPVGGVIVRQIVRVGILWFLAILGTGCRRFSIAERHLRQIRVDIVLDFKRQHDRVARFSGNGDQGTVGFVVQIVDEFGQDRVAVHAVGELELPRRVRRVFGIRYHVQGRRRGTQRDDVPLFGHRRRPQIGIVFPDSDQRQQIVQGRRRDFELVLGRLAVRRDGKHRHHLLDNVGELRGVGRVQGETGDAEEGQDPIEFPFLRFRCVGGRSRLQRRAGRRTRHHGTDGRRGEDDVHVTAPRHHKIIQIQVDDAGVAVDAIVVGEAATVPAPPQLERGGVGPALRLVLHLTVDVGFSAASSCPPFGHDGAVAQIPVALDLGVGARATRQPRVAGLRAGPPSASRHPDLTQPTGPRRQTRIGDDGFGHGSGTGLGREGRRRIRDEPGRFLDAARRPPLPRPADHTVHVSSGRATPPTPPQ